MDKLIQEYSDAQSLDGFETEPATYLDQIEGSNDIFERIRKKNLPKKKKKVRFRDSDDEINNNGNNEPANTSTSSRVIRDMATQIIKAKLANPKFNMPQQRQVIATETGTFINSVKDTRFDPTWNVWEGIRSLPGRDKVIEFLSSEGWKIPACMDYFNPSSTQKVTLAPLCFQPWWDLGYYRILMKMVDDSPQTLEDKLVAMTYALQCLKWVLMKRAAGKSDQKVQRAIIYSLQDSKSIFKHRARLSDIDKEGGYLGRTDFNSTRFDRKPTREFKNERGCIAPDRFDALNKQKEKSEVEKLKKDKPFRQNVANYGSYSSNNNNNNNNNKNNNSIKRKPKYSSAFSVATGKAPAPVLDRFFNPSVHKPKVEGGGFPRDLCREWQTDSCKTSAETCHKWHKCQYCGGKHPGSQCKNKN